jgi:hypothetical protein
MPKNPVDPEELRWRREVAMATKLFSAYTRAMHLRLQNFKPSGNPEKYASVEMSKSYGLDWRVEVTDRYHWVPEDYTAPRHLAPKKKIRPPGGERIWFNGYYWKSMADVSKRKYKWVLKVPLERIPSDTVIHLKSDADRCALFQRINDAAMCFRDFLRDHCERDELLKELLAMRSSAKSGDLNTELSKRVRPKIHERNFIRVLKALGVKTRRSAVPRAPHAAPRDASVDDDGEVDEMRVRLAEMTSAMAATESLFKSGHRGGSSGSGHALERENIELRQRLDMMTSAIATAETLARDDDADDDGFSITSTSIEPETPASRVSFTPTTEVREF